MSVTVNHSVTAQLSHAATLGDLEELLLAAQAAGLTRGARLHIEHHRGDQRDPSYTTITVTQR